VAQREEGIALVRRIVHALDERLGSTPLLKKALRYVFPDHWTFLFGEIALYAFVVLVGTGIYLTLFFEPSTAQTVYQGPYAPLHGFEMSKAYSSTLDISYTVPAGLLIRQTHHWAADVFLVAIVVHLMRVFFTGAFRKPRDLNYAIGVTMLGFAILEGFLGYSLVDDLLSGMGLGIAYSVAMSFPVVGANVAFLLWGGEFPGADSFEPRIFIAHVLIIPVLIATLIVAHLAIIMRQKHSQFAGRGRTEQNVVGTPLWPAYALRSTGLLFAVAGILFLMGGLIQINPIWQWGPYEPWQGTNGAQPDWYMGWLIGALRLMPSFEPHIDGWTLAPNPFFGGVFFPIVVFGALYLWPAIERRITRDHARHDLLDRPRDNPWRTAVGVAFFTWVFTVFAAGSSDRVFVDLGVPYTGQVWFFRVALFVFPVITFFVSREICRELKDTELHPLRKVVGTAVRRAPDGGYVATPIEQERRSAGNDRGGETDSSMSERFADR
jgi:quinol---cytochrome-c reductase cytochrome b subunit